MTDKVPTVRVARSLFGFLIAAATACSLGTGLSGFSSGGPPAATLGEGGANTDAPATSIVDGGPNTGNDVATTVDGAGTAYRDLIVGEKPVAYFRLGERGPAEPVVDEVGSLTGRFVDNALPGQEGAIAGDPNTSVSFDGESGEIVIAGASKTNFADRSPFTIEAWIRPASIDTEYRRIVTNESAGDGPRQGWNLWVVGGTNGGLGVERYRDGSEDSAESRVLPGLNVWSHVAAVYNGATLTVFMNGELVGSTVSTYAMLPQTNLRIGSGNGGQYWHGGIDEVALYDRALDITALKQHYVTGKR